MTGDGNGWKTGKGVRFGDDVREIDRKGRSSVYVASQQGKFNIYPLKHQEYMHGFVLVGKVSAFASAKCGSLR